MSIQKGMDILTFYVNGKCIEEKNPDPNENLLDYLRNKLRLCGAKEACGEGICGACTIIVSRFDPRTNKISNLAVNACLVPICSVHESAILTVEGLGSIEYGLHPIQERIAKGHGTQCGFCTPGFVMSMHALLRNNPNPTEDALRISLQGNLCRCTGYRPILDSLKTFCCKGDKGSNDNRCMKNTKKMNTLFDQTQFKPYKPSQDPIFPPALKLFIKENEKSNNDLTFCTWERPSTFHQARLLYHDHPKYFIVAGNLENGINQKFNGLKAPGFIEIGHIEELKAIKIKDNLLEIGSCATVTQLEDFCLNQIIPGKVNMFNGLLSIIKYFGNQQTRNVGTIGGNLLAQRPISDLKSIFLALNAKLNFVNWENSLVTSINEFLQSSRECLKKSYILEKITIPLNEKDEYIWTYKQSKRKENDSAIVNCAFKIKINSDGIIQNLCLAFGCFGNCPAKLCTKGSEFLIGKQWKWEVIQKVLQILADELFVDENDATIYQKSLVRNLFYKGYLQINEWTKFSQIPQNEKSILDVDNAKISSKSSQIFQVENDEHDLVGKPIPHLASSQHATGEAIYVNDIPSYCNEYFGYFVRSTISKGKIKSVELPKMSADEEIHYFNSSDLKHNNMGIILFDEELFASIDITHYGQIIGFVVSRDKMVAEKASKNFKISYEIDEADKPIYTIEDAISRNSYLLDGIKIKELKSEDFDQNLKKSDRVLEGEFYMGGQEHFYMETNVCLVIPKEDGEIEVNMSTQSPAQVQEIIAKSLGLQSNRVIVKCRRVGGGFGGKETRCAFMGVGCSVAALRLKAPVRCVLNRHEDMEISGQRHPYLCKYKVGFNLNGSIQGIQARLFANCGDTLDWSSEVMDAALSSLDGTYKILNWDLYGLLCKTNIQSFTAFRGFGRPQGHLMSENIIDAIAANLEMEPHILREKHLYKNGDSTPYGHIIKNSTLDQCWSQCLESAEYEQRLNSIKEFNSRNKWLKRGLSIVPIKHGMGLPMHHNQATAIVMIYQDGSVNLSHGGVEIGQGLNSKMIQVASRALGVSVDRIYTSEMSTDKIPNSTPTVASISADVNGWAVLYACNELKSRLDPLKKSNPQIKWDELIDTAYKSRINLTAVGFHENLLEKGTGTDYMCFGAACSEVQVDCLTGSYSIERVDICFDVGQSLNPAIDIGQIEGAFVQGVGLYTLEELEYSSKNGELLTKGAGLYRIPTISSIPKEFNVSLLRGSSNVKAVYSSKAVGEPPFFSSGSVFFAIKNAIRSFRVANNLSREFQLNSPATCDKVIYACEHP